MTTKMNTLHKNEDTVIKLPLHLVTITSQGLQLEDR